MSNFDLGNSSLVPKDLQEEVKIEKSTEKPPQMAELHNSENISKFFEKQDLGFIQLEKKDIPQIYTFTLNQTQNLIGLGTVEGYRIYFTNKLGQNYKRINEKKEKFELESGIKLLSFLYDTCILALVTDGCNKRYPSSKVYIYDDTYRRIIREYEFHHPIIQLHYMRELLFVASEKRILIFDIDKHKPVKYIVNSLNPEMLFINGNYDYLNYIYLLKEPGQLFLNNIWLNNQLILDINNDNAVMVNPPQEEIKDGNPQSKPTGISLQSNLLKKIGYASLSYDGKRAAVADEQGINIKVYDTLTGQVAKSYYRGQQVKLITSMEFSRDNKILALISTSENPSNDYATLHVFDLEDANLQYSKKRFYFMTWKDQAYTFGKKLISPKLIIRDSSHITVISTSEFFFEINIQLNSDSSRNYGVIDDHKKVPWIELLEESEIKTFD